MIDGAPAVGDCVFRLKIRTLKRKMRKEARFQGCGRGERKTEKSSEDKYN